MRTDYGYYQLPNKPRNDAELSAHRRGLQSWFRSFQPSFSDDPYVVQEFAQGAPVLFRKNPLQGAPRNVRGPIADFAPGGRTFEQMFSGKQAPSGAFYYDPVFGNLNPMSYENRWGSWESLRRQNLPRIFQAKFPR